MTIDTIENKGRTAQILLIEDNYGDVVLTKKAFKSAKIPSVITVASDGIEAMAYLRREGKYSSSSLPDLILMDLNLPKTSGEGVLAEIKTNKDLKHIPVIILTSSSAKSDVNTSYRLNANGYIIKPVSLERFDTVVKAIEQFWFSVVVLSHD